MYYAVITIGKQREGDFDFINILTGEKHIKEEDKGEGKTRTHLAFYPTGNGKFFRLEDEYISQIDGNLIYDTDTKTIIPKKITIPVNNFDEKIVLKFSIDKAKKIITIKTAFFE